MVIFVVCYERNHVLINYSELTGWKQLGGIQFLYRLNMNAPIFAYALFRPFMEGKIKTLLNI